MKSVSHEDSVRRETAKLGMALDVGWRSWDHGRRGGV